MRKTHFLLAVIPGILFCSCDKVKNLVGKARTAVEEKVSKTGESTDSKPDPELQKLVDQTPEGVIFRKDLPFPNRLEVMVNIRHELAGRYVKTSALGTEANVVKGTETQACKYERAGEQVRLTPSPSTFVEAVAADEKSADAKKPEPKSTTAPFKFVVFQKAGNVWKADRSQGLSVVVFAQMLAPMFDQLLVEQGVAPHSMWFGKKRLKLGDQLTVADKSLPMLLAGEAKGSLVLTLRAFEAVHGHPCGVFDVKGNYSRRQFPGVDGHPTDEDVAIQSGKLWLSLLYPLVLREETDTIQTQRIGSGEGVSSHGQGSMKVSVIREWKKTGP